MATPSSFHCSNKVRTSFSDKTCGRSKAQMCLKKILDIISSGSSSIQPCEILKRTSQNLLSNELKYEKVSSNEKVRDLFIEKPGFGIDLNLRLGLPLDSTESENLTVNKGFSACSGVGDGDDDGDGDGDGKVCEINIDCNSSVISAEFFTKSSEGECDPKEVANSPEVFPVHIEEEEEQEVIEEERREFSEITNLPAIETNRVLRDESEDGKQSEIKPEEEREDEVEVDEEEEEREKRKEEGERSSRRRDKKNEGYLDLLVEAARLISGNFEDDEDDEDGKNRTRNRQLSNEETQMINEAETGRNKSIGCRSKRNQCWTFDFYEDFEDISPIVRSKRGRNQVLPLRYRDSVLDPWKRLSKQRSSRVSSKNKT